MKILYAVQGTGNGHVSRAIEIYPALARYGKTDILISGTQADLSFPHPVRYTLHGLSFIFGRHGGIDLWKTLKGLKPGRLLSDIINLPVRSYDLVISDFEPVSAWACRLRRVPCIGLSHQSAVLDPNAPVPDVPGGFAKRVLRHYAPASVSYGFHFKSFSGSVYTPVIREDVRNIPIRDEGHYTVYLPAYDDALLVKHLSRISNDDHWQVFSKHNRKPFTCGNIRVRPVEQHAFLESMATSHGVLCGAGFETPAEAMYLGKKLMVIPMQHQYEQQCNAAALAQIGIPVIRHLGRSSYDQVRQWLRSVRKITVRYPDHTSQIIEQIIREHCNPFPAIPAW